MTKHALIYLRVSSAQQANTDYDPEGFSIPDQREACRRKAQALDAIVVEEFVDKGIRKRRLTDLGCKQCSGA